MTFQEMAMRMVPYWLMGLMMLAIVYNSKYKALLKIDKKAVLKFIKFMGFVTIGRIILFAIAAKLGSNSLNELSGVTQIPWQGSLFVFWEDMCHTVPLAITALIIGSDKWYKKVIQFLLLAIIMVSFGMGHTYQGVFAATMLSLYIPFTLRRAKQYGFGTIMLCHTFYDLITILTVKLFIG